MNANEAKAISDKRAAALKAEQEAEQEARRKQAVKDEIIAARNFLSELRDSCDKGISYAAAHGENSYTKHIVTKDHMCDSGEKWLMETHKYASEVQKVMAELIARGFKTEIRHRTNEHSTEHESSVEDYTYDDYSTVLKISW